MLDREIRSWPSIDWQQYPGGISGSNGAQISGSFTVGEAKDLALVLQTGALPVKFVTLDQTAISATLGKDSLNEAKKAAVVGLLLVALFLLVFYRFLGLVAVLGLGIYAAFLYAAILLFNVTLTLPGFAGLVLTLGVAADANVVIFERIKEESRAGRSVRAAIQTGYTKGFATIVDANVVTAITALVLFGVATASVRGFALMLLIGTAVSIEIAVPIRSISAKPRTRRGGDPEQHECRDRGDDIRIDDRGEAFGVARLDRRAHAAACARFLLDALEDDDVRVGGHPQCQHEPREAGQRQGDVEEEDRGVQECGVDAEAEHGDETEEAIKDEQEQRDQEQADDGRLLRLVERVLTQRGGDRRLVERDELDRQGSGLQHEREILRLADREAAADLVSVGARDAARVLLPVDRRPRT